MNFAYEPTTTARVHGHALVDEGRVLGVFGPVKMAAHARCTCGAKSADKYETVADRKRWHRRHKGWVIALRDGSA